MATGPVLMATGLGCWELWSPLPVFLAEFISVNKMSSVRGLICTALPTLYYRFLRLAKSQVKLDSCPLLFFNCG